MRRTAALVSCLALALPQGCGSTRGYEGPPLPKERLATLQAARLETDMGFKQRAIRLCEVDGRTVGTNFRGYPEKIEIAPGDHKIRFRYYDSDVDGLEASPVRELSMKAAAGARYLITFDPKEVSQRTAIWIEDRRSGEIVGGEAPRAKAAARPRAGIEIARPDWKAISPESSVRIHALSGLVVSGRVISDDGEYLWLQLSQGGKKAFLRSEIDKIVAVK